MSANILLEAAELLEKAAAYIEETENDKRASETQVQREAASKLAAVVSDAVGEPMSPELIEKLSHVDPEIRGLLSKMSGYDTVDPMGGPSSETKVASISDGMGSAESDLLTFLMT